MTEAEISNLIAIGNFPDPCRHSNLVETHISWVILCDQYVYKIKKPIRYSFLDFSTPEKRKYFCDREVMLNRRLTTDMYLGVIPVQETEVGIHLGKGPGKSIDHAVRMRRMDGKRQMNILLNTGQVSPDDIRLLAARVARFHQKAEIFYAKDIFEIGEKFKDLAAESAHLSIALGVHAGQLIERSLTASARFLNQNAEVLKTRLTDGFYRDGHGDLHCRNIFLQSEPVIFDCIEFSDDFRQVDVLNDVAFLCMDLDAFGRQDLSDLFLKTYNRKFPVIRSRNEQCLFSYYKSYRANIRAKVNSLRSRDAGYANKEKALEEAEKYLKLMAGYIADIF